MVAAAASKRHVMLSLAAMLAGIVLFTAGFTTWAPRDPCPEDFSSYPEGTVIQCSDENGPTASSWALHAAGLAAGLGGLASVAVGLARMHPPTITIQPAGRVIRRPLDQRHEQVLGVGVLVAFAAVTLVDIGLPLTSSASDWTQAILRGLFVVLIVQMMPVLFWAWANQPPLRSKARPSASAPQS